MERYRTTLIMVALLAVLSVIAVMLANQNKGNLPDAGTTPTPAPTYLWQEEGQVLEIDIMSGTQKVSLRKDISATVWMLSAPEQYPADTFQVNSIASQLQSLQATQVNTGTDDLAPFGLDKPGLTVVVKFSGTTPITRTLQAGASNFDETGTYVKQSDSKEIYLAASTLIGALKNWLATPPKEPPTPTPFPTAPPTATPTATVVATPAGPIGPQSSSSPSPIVAGSPVATSTPTVLGQPTLGVTEPGAANVTTPVSATATPTP